MTTKIPETEAGFQQAVIQLAHLHGWAIAHFARSVSVRGRHMTAVAADGAGWVDLVLVRDRILFRELKSEHGRLSALQVRWRSRIEEAGGDYAVWRPSQFDEIKEALA